MEVSEIRKRLQLAPQAAPVAQRQPGMTWFSVDERHLAFAPHKTPGHRAVVLREWPSSGPIATVFARSTTSRTGYVHAAHGHKGKFPKCWLNRRARIVLEWPLKAKKSVLNSVMCEEPDPAATRRVLSAAVTR